MKHLLIVATAAASLSCAMSSFALDAAPYTNEAVQRLTRATNSVERARTAKDPTENLKRQMAMFEQLYSKAGYSFEKSLMRFIKELSEDGMPPMVPQPQLIQRAYLTLYEETRHG